MKENSQQVTEADRLVQLGAAANNWAVAREGNNPKAMEDALNLFAHELSQPGGMDALIQLPGAEIGKSVDMNEGVPVILSAEKIISVTGQKPDKETSL